MTAKSLRVDNHNSANLVHVTESDFDNLCLPCIVPKQSCTIIQKKVITKAYERLKEVQVNLWGVYHLILLFKKIFAIILLDPKIQKTWIIYL